jgi:hypothetical protein
MFAFRVKRTSLRRPPINEWTSVREQFDALVRGRSDNIEDILDAQFRNRFSQLINQAAERART